LSGYGRCLEVAGLIFEKEGSMTLREELMERFQERKANREEEISKIPLSFIRSRYQRRVSSDEKLREIMSKSGDYFIKKWNKPFLIPILHVLYSLTWTWVFKKQFHLGEKPRDFFDSVLDYCMFATSYGAGDFEVEEVTRDRVVGYVTRCPMKLDNHLKLCYALTSMEPRLSKKPYYGAKITYRERIPEGARRCTAVFEKK
jgi:hypothetical protein